jgi:Ca2+-binding EF-hand superfamily protein
MKIATGSTGQRRSSVRFDADLGRDFVVLDEVEINLRKLLSKFDKNGDGVIDGEELLRAARSSVVFNEETGKKMIVLADVEPSLRELLAKFDVNNDGVIDEDELKLAAKRFVETEQQNRFLKWAVAVVVAAAAIIVGSLAGIQHKQLDASKDTEIQPDSGNLMVKSASGANAEIEVSTKAHGVSVVTQKAVFVDPEGVSKELLCVPGEKVKDVFESHAFGTPAQLIAMDSANGSADIYTLGMKEGSGSSASWNDDDIKIGDFVFEPSLECTVLNENPSTNRKLALIDLLTTHNDHKSDVFNRICTKSGLSGCATNDEGNAAATSSSNLRQRKLKVDTYYDVKSTSSSPSPSETSFPSAWPTSYVSSDNPTLDPTPLSSSTPSANPSLSPAPSNIPSGKPSGFPSGVPSYSPSANPSGAPSSGPSSVCDARCGDNRRVVEATSGSELSYDIRDCLSQPDLSQPDCDISCWNTARVTSMGFAFLNKPSFNLDLSCWNTSKVTRMDSMFSGALEFNFDINNW